MGQTKNKIKQLVGTIAAITVFVIFLVKWNSTLENEAKRTQQLYESERPFPGLLVDYASRFQT
jgi:hypothetical protein